MSVLERVDLVLLKPHFSQVEEPWLVEKMLLSAVPLPLNVQGNAHPFTLTVKSIRKAAKETVQGCR